VSIRWGGQSESSTGSDDEPESTKEESSSESDFDSFEALYQSLWAPMLRLAWLLSGSREDAEDLVHDVFLAMEHKWQGLRDPAPYIRKSVVNGVRAHKRHAEVEVRHRPLPAPPILDPEIEEIWQLVDRLPDRQRQALVLRFYLDMTVEQVADHLGCPTGTAKSLIHRGIKQIGEKAQG
jgi:RNA polymerase sigma factor (sigma-70 family)